MGLEIHEQKKPTSDLMIEEKDEGVQGTGPQGHLWEFVQLRLRHGSHSDPGKSSEVT